ncbi:alpha/beta hydrolase [Aliiglaciecola sp. 3_MG-2023]|uniref:alpha/beta family hydrolase n=1 Tax=Aliiglaciecola sp. 3_MG-2023 TaxID=3062644 RepID=UPI0026E2BC5B|nr:alpha/beta family hydrolase [Aliiglaciecola sp. 3_MG-2023]MDO6695556.1 alpha/beta hydrolase [Aliiglaciecola sp. 3_MG-2023]
MKILINRPDKPFARFIFAHGAGANKQSHFMEQIAKLLCLGGVEVVRFDFPYMLRAAEKNKRQPPDRANILLQDFTEMVNSADTELPLFIGGKSMGGRMASMLESAGTVENVNLIKGVICLGYPFHPPGKPEKQRTEHLYDAKLPILIIQGERDTFGNRSRVESYQLPSIIDVQFLAAADHSFVPLKSSGIGVDEHIRSAADQIIKFMKGQI